MSLTYTLRRWLDPDFATASELAEQERLLEHADAPVPGGAGDMKIFRLALRKRTVRCRICGRASEGSAFCITCLADTME